MYIILLYKKIFNYVSLRIFFRVLKYESYPKINLPYFITHSILIVHLEWNSLSADLTSFSDQFPTRNLTIVKQRYVGIQRANIYWLLSYAYTVYCFILSNAILFKLVCDGWVFVQKLVSLLTHDEFMWIPYKCVFTCRIKYTST